TATRVADGVGRLKTSWQGAIYVNGTRSMVTPRSLGTASPRWAHPRHKNQGKRGMTFWIATAAEVTHSTRLRRP
ncbi:unnamed protein product, partial [Ectocarpus sp. 8 AP-2014]